MAIQPPEIDAFPPPPQRGNKETFADLFDAVITWFSISVSKVGQACLSAYQNAVAAALSASSAEAAAEAATFASGAAQWVSGTTYTKGKVVWSVANGRTYRRLIAGAGTTDPAADRVNWVILSSEPDILAMATVTAAVANIDFLNVFSADYDKYTIEVQGISLSTAAQINVVLAYGGTPATDGSYYMTSPGNQVGAPNNAFFIGSIHTAMKGVLTIEIKNVNGAGPKGVSARGMLPYDSVYFVPIVVEGLQTKPTSASGFRLFSPQAASISAGTVRVFGHRNS
jgi:hypothetical protein